MTFSRDNTPLPPSILQIARAKSIERPALLRKLRPTPLNEATTETPLYSVDRSRSASSASSSSDMSLAAVAPSSSSSPPTTTSSLDSSVPATEPDSPRFTNQVGWFHLFTPDVGEPIARMGHYYVWSETHPRISQLTKLRSLSDDDADLILERLQCGFSGDCVSLAAERATRHCEGGVVSASLSEVDRETDKLCYEFLQRYSTIPEWVDWERMTRGQLVFQRYCQTSLLSLLYSSLLGGFGAPLINKVLTSTNYLSGSCPATYRRLVETTLMICACVGPNVDAMKSPWTDPKTSPPTTGNSSTTTSTSPSVISPPSPLPTHYGDGWLSTLRVRFLHAKVRSMLRSRPSWDYETYGIPINQEDMLATLLAFSFNVTWSLGHVNIHMANDEKEDYIHLWRYIGYLSGIRMDVLDQHMTSYDRSMKCSEAIMYHLVHPDATSYLMAEHVLSSVNACFPLRWSYDFHLALSRAMMTDDWADSLKLPKSSRWARLKVKMFFLATKMIVKAGNLHPVIGKALCANNWFMLNRALNEYTRRHPSSQSKALREAASKEKIRASPPPTNLHKNSHLFAMAAEHVPPIDSGNTIPSSHSNPHIHGTVSAAPSSSSGGSVSGDVAKCPFFAGVNKSKLEAIFNDGSHIGTVSGLDTLDSSDISDKKSIYKSTVPLWQTASRPFDLLVELLGLAGISTLVTLMLFFVTLSLVLITGWNPVEYAWMEIQHVQHELKDVVLPQVQRSINQYAEKDPHAFLFSNIITSVTANLSAIAYAPFQQE